MQIFLTGATGYIGSAVLETFVRAGHSLTALVRDPEKAEYIGRRGVHPVIGDLDKPASYAGEAERAEVIVHTAMDGSARLTRPFLRHGRAIELIGGGLVVLIGVLIVFDLISVLSRAFISLWPQV
jgi:uncharacterized protein YbjT (DUF2867 family)